MKHLFFILFVCTTNAYPPYYILSHSSDFQASKDISSSLLFSCAPPDKKEKALSFKIGCCKVGVDLIDAAVYLAKAMQRFVTANHAAKQFVATYAQWHRTDFEKAALKQIEEYGDVVVSGFGCFAEDQTTFYQDNILSEYHLYQFAGFREYIKTFSHYDAHIRTLCARVRCDSQNRKNKWWKDFPGYFDKSFPEIVEELYAHLEQRRVKQQQQAHQYRKELQKNHAIMQQRVRQNADQMRAFVEEFALEIEAGGYCPHQIKRLNERLGAITQSEQTGYAAHISSYALSEQTKTLLRSCSIKIDSFTYCDGSLIQQQIHHELIAILDQTAVIHYTHVRSNINTLFPATIATMADVAVQYNQAGHVKQALTLTDCCWGFLECLIGIGQGSIDGVRNAAQTLCHPIQTVQNMAHGLHSAAWHGGRVLYELCDIAAECIVDFDAGWDRVKQTKIKIKATVEELGTKIENLSIREASRAVTACGVEMVLTKKCLNCMHMFYKGAYQEISHVMSQIERGLQPPAALAGYPMISIASEAIDHANTFAQAARGIGSKPYLAGMALKAIGNATNQPVNNNEVLKVANMKQFFNELEFGKLLKGHSIKTNNRYNGQAIYRLEKTINNDLQKGYQFYLDSLHYDHIEVFNAKGAAQSVFNLDGVKNIKKTAKAIQDSRRI